MKKNIETNQEKKLTLFKDILTIVIIVCWVGIKVSMHTSSTFRLPLLVGFAATGVASAILFAVLNVVFSKKKKTVNINSL